MKAYTNVSRKTVGEDRVAICPNFGCEYMARVKPLKFRFLGFGKHPKCKKHRIPLVYVDERIVDFVDAALACLFDKAGLPPSELLESIKSKFHNEVTSFVEGWVYCITAGRGASIISRYMDTISNAYLKQLSKKQIKALKKGDDSKPNLVNKTIKDGMDEITIQYTRILKHLRAHSEILIDHQTLKSLSKNLRNYLKDYQKTILKRNEIINSPENKREMSLKEIKSNYDQILNVGTCRCLLGLIPESKEIKEAKITSFDRFTAYHEFFSEGLTGKFTKSAICDLVKTKFTYQDNIDILDETKYKIPFQNQKPKSIMTVKCTQEELLGKIFKFGESLQLGILTIYYICDIFPKKNEIDKLFFSGKELSQILSKSEFFFNNIRRELLDENFVQYCGTISKKKHSFVKIYTITKQGADFAAEIIKSKIQEFSNLFNDLTLRLEQRYKEYNKELMSSENNIVIRSIEEINNDLKKIAEENNAKMLTTYKSDENKIIFRCKECNKEFKDIYKNIKRRQEPKIACPFCFPELRPNTYIPEELREKIAKYVLVELRQITIYNLVEKEILENIVSIRDSVFRQIEIKKAPILDNRIQADADFRQYIKNYIQLIVKLLIKIKLLNETKQKINITEVAKETHDKKIVSLKSWVVFSTKIIQYLRQNLDFNIRSRHHDTFQKSAQVSIRNFRNLYKLIDDITITYLKKDLQMKIDIHYNGICQGNNGACQFNVDYRFLPALSHHHLLKNYKKLITRKEFKYILPHTILNLKFERAIKLMQTQIGGLGLACLNCHFSKHHVIYNFSPIFTFLQKLSLENINENPSDVLIKLKSLVSIYYNQKKKKTKMSKNYTQAQQKTMIKDGIRKSTLAFVKKKYSIQFLFGNDYVCPICRKANINEHLNCFVAHHTNEDIFRDDLEKIEFGKEYKKKDIDWLIENIIIQECVFICINCHQMLHAVNFRDYALTILESKTDEIFVRNYYSQLDKQISKLKNRILILKKKIENHLIQIPNPLQLIFEKGDGLKRNLICIYYICEVFSKDKENPFFTSGELNFIINKARSFRNFKHKLIHLDYIQVVENFQRIYHITPKGKEKARELINQKLNDFPKRFRDLIDIWENNYVEYQLKMKQNKYFFGKEIL